MSTPDESVRTEEFDAFGPWVYEVTTPDEVPRLYREHPLDVAACRMVLKVPRDIVRRDANPTMDLYDHLLAAGPDGLTVLSRRATGYDTVDLPYESITAIEHSVDLLDGRVSVRTSQPRAAVRISYNGSSDDIVGAFVRVLREEYLGREGPRSPLPSVAPLRHLRLGDLGDEDVSLVTEQHAVRREDPGLLLVAAHPRSGVAPVAAGGPSDLVARATHAAWPMTLQGALVCTDGREVLVIHRRHWWLRGRRPVNSVARTVIPVSRVDDVAVREHGRYKGVLVVTVTLGKTVLSFPVPSGSDAATVLPEVLAPQQ